MESFHASLHARRFLSCLKFFGDKLLCLSFLTLTHSLTHMFDDEQGSHAASFNGKSVSPVSNSPTFQQIRILTLISLFDVPGIPASKFTELVRAKIFNSTRGGGGYDKLYTFVSSDPVTSNPTGQCDSRSIAGPFAGGTTKCALLKGFHQPPGARMQKFTDEISFGVYESSPNSCTVRAFSRTKLVSVYCDGGINYENLQSAILNLGILTYVETTLYGCPQKQ